MPMLVGQHLDLHMTRIGDVALEVERAVAKGGKGLVGRGGEHGCHVGFMLHDLHAPPATPGGGLDHHGQAHLAGNGRGLLRRLDLG